MSDKSILTRIKALLAKASGTDNEAEAEAFFAKAYELMEKYQLDAEDLDRDDPMGNEFTCQRKGTVAPDWDFRLMRGCAMYYGAEAIRWWRKTPSGSGWAMRLVGRESARVTAMEMHKYLVKTVRRLGREHWIDMRCSNPDAAARRIGTMLNERLISLAPKPATAGSLTKAASNALVTMGALEAYIKKEFPDLREIHSKTIRTKSAQDIAAGIGLNLQAGHSGQKRLS